MDKPFRVAPDVYVIPTWVTFPEIGTLSFNSFLFTGKEPLLVDTTIGVRSEEFLQKLSSLIDPSEIRWVWLSHDDIDHVGSLKQILDMAPEAKLAAHNEAILRQSLSWKVPMNRVHALAPGHKLEAGERTFHPMRPPLFDNPGTLGFFEESTKTYFAVDCFGTFVPEAMDDVGGLSESELKEGMTAWATVDSPWCHLVDEGKFAAVLDEVRRLEPQQVIGAHLPPARGMLETLLGITKTIPSADPAEVPNHLEFAEWLEAGYDPSKG